MSLRTLENDEIIASWRAPGDKLKSGWNTFGLSRSTSGLRRTLRLELCIEGDGKPPAVSLGAIQPVPAYRLTRLEGGEAVSTRNLAIIVWTGLPGVRAPEWASFWLAEGDRIEFSRWQERAIGTKTLAAVTELAGNMTDKDWLRYLPEEGEVLCHPPAHGITVGVIPFAVPRRATRVSATVHVANTQSRPVEFAIVALLPDRAQAGEVARSEWVKVSSDQRKSINLFLDAPAATNLNLAICTRMATQGNNDFAWARFADFSALIDAHE
jgi:Family of unknown function (DUF6212)